MSMYVDVDVDVDVDVNNVFMSNVPVDVMLTTLFSFFFVQKSLDVQTRLKEEHFHTSEGYK